MSNQSTDKPKKIGRFKRSFILIKILGIYSDWRRTLL
jgi:hypothetical protein